MDFSIVIPTKDRPSELKECVDSILNQQKPPKDVVVVDDGNLPESFIQSCESGLKSHSISFKYCKKNITGSALSRNMGVSLASEEVVLILDDDTVLSPNYTQIIMALWDNFSGGPKLGGIGGIIENMRNTGMLEKIYNKIFLLSSDYKWDVTDTGFQVWDTEIKDIQKSYYLIGGVSSYRKSLLQAIPFRQIGTGRSAGEDVDFFIKAKKAGFYFLICPFAKIQHKETPVSRENEFDRGIKDGYNQCDIFSNNFKASPASVLKFGWSSIGWVLRQLLAVHLLKAAGMAAGYIKYIFSSTVRSGRRLG